jgi:hypothetical protein
MSRDNAVGIATDYRLDDKRGQSSSPNRVKNFLFSTSSRPVLGPTQPPFQWVLRALSPWVKRPGHETDHSSPTSAEVKKIWIYTSTPSYVFMAYCLISLAKGQLYPFHLFTETTDWCLCIAQL